MRVFVRILAGLVFALTLLLCALLLYLRHSGPVFTEGTVQLLSRDENPALWESWLNRMDPNGEETQEDDLRRDTENSRMIVYSVNVSNPGPIPVEWIGIMPEIRPAETLVSADNGPLVLAPHSEGTLKAAILSRGADEKEPRSLTISGYRLGEMVTVRLEADENGIHMKGEEQL